MKILVTHSYFLRFDAKQWKQQQPYAPLATLYAVSVLENLNHDVVFTDMMFAKSADEIIPHLQKHKPDIVLIYDDGFNYLTKMCLTNMREACFSMINSSKQSQCKVIVSSSDSTDHSDEYLKHGADFIVVGEGETTLKLLVEKIENNDLDYTEVAGLRFLNDGKMVTTPPRDVIRELDSIPLPAWDKIDMQSYKHAWQKKWGYFSINITTTRGCPFKCNWCAKPIYGNRYNVRSAALVVDELVMLKKKLNYNHVWFCDDIFGLKPGWIKQFAEAIKSRNLKIKFKIQCRADLLLEENNIQWLAQAGCDEVWMGAESGSQKILDAMDKGTKIEQIELATALLKKHGIKPCFFLQFGYPGEIKEDILMTLNMVNKLQPFDIGVSVSYPLPGTKFYETVKSQLSQKSNWSDSDELALMFKNTYPSSFYKELHRYLHRKFRGRQGVSAWQKIASFKRINLGQLKSAVVMPYHFVQQFYHQIQLQKFDFKV
nr:radical SAM protein [Bacteroidota bacterium]